MITEREFIGGILDGCPVTDVAQYAAPADGDVYDVPRVYTLGDARAPIVIGTEYKLGAVKRFGCWRYRRMPSGDFYAWPV